MRPRAKLFEIPSGFGNSNDWYTQMSTLHHALQRWKNFLVSQIACCAEEDQRVRMQIAHKSSLGLCLFSRLLQVSTELKPHCGQEFVCKACFASRFESLEQSGGQNRNGHCFIDCSLDGPAPLAGVRYTACE